LEEKNMNKKLLSLALALVLALSLTACGSSSSSTDTSSTSSDTTTDTAAADTTTDTSAETVVLNVAASPTPHAEILEQCVPILAEQGIDLQIHEYGDYVIPNTAVEEGDEDANYFQHVPYLDNFNAENGTHLVSVAGVHIEPMGIYAGKTASLDDLADGASVAVPNDVTNEARALLLLEAQGLITLSDDAGLEATPNDIVDNPKNLTFTELEAAMVPNVVSEVDIAVINSNYAMQAGFNPVTDALAIEDADSPYVNVLVVKEGNEDNAAIQALVAALQSDTVRDFINENYGGAVVPVF
jgi:D-methionine transport system substrate-binding protein